MADKGHTFGIFTKEQSGVRFKNLQARIVDDNNAFHPDNTNSPNHPRVEGRFEGYQNPILGDEGIGRIGRWQQIKLDALENMIDQIIEQYLRDESWYSKVRCREALWNMYRRLEWYVEQEVDPAKNQYKRVLQMIEDCINKILENAQDPEGTHAGVSLPYCPTPYTHKYSASYFNHYDKAITERVLFSLASLSFDELPGFFRYVSSSEEQEWELVHSVGGDESVGSENILKFNLDDLVIGNSSKIDFKWRFKKRGYISFKYLASVDKGNGLLFYINGNQVGGEWSQENEWQEVKFNVTPGQTFKFDWLVRKMSELQWGYNAIYIKDVKCVEVIKSLEEPTPPDFDTLGGDALKDPAYEWVTFSNSSIVKTYFNGSVGDNRRTFEMELKNECDGEISFAYKMGSDNPAVIDDIDLIFDDKFENTSQYGEGKYGSNITSNHGFNWSLDGEKSQTNAGNSLISYDINVGEGADVSIKGTINMVCPEIELDHYNETVIDVLQNNFTFSGVNVWNKNNNELVMYDPIVEGTGDATATITLNDGGELSFSFDHELRSTESFEVLVDGKTEVHSVGDKSNKTATVSLSPGTHSITFRVSDISTEQPLTNKFDRYFNYKWDAYEGRWYDYETPLGNKVRVKREWRVTNKNAWTDVDGEKIYYEIELNPGDSFHLREIFELQPEIDEYDADLIFEEYFNDVNNIDSDININNGWKWIDILKEFYGNGWSGDGVLCIKGETSGKNIVELNNLNMINPGYVEFEYGGHFKSGQKLELYADGKKIWEGDEDTDEDLKGKTVKVPVPSGTSQLEWVYEVGEISYGGGSNVIILPPETCYASGYEDHAIDYGMLENSLTTSRQTRVGWDSKTANKYSWEGLYIAHGTTVDKAVFERDFTTPSYGSVDYKERLKVYAGTGMSDSVFVEVDPVMKYYGGGARTFYTAPNYYAITPLDLKPVGTSDNRFDEGAVIYTDGFYVDGEFVLSLNYHAYLQGRGWGNKINSEYMQRAKFIVNLWRYDSTNSKWTLVETLLEDLENRGDYKQNYRYIDNWSDARSLEFTRNLESGYYSITFELKDLCYDYDVDENDLPFYVVFQESIKVKNEVTVDSYDNTRVLVELIDKSTGEVIYSQYYDTDGQESKEYLITFNSLGDSSYKVKYTLLKGGGTGDGLDNNGGGFTLSKGVFSEYWAEYCIDANGNYYPKGDNPYDVGSGSDDSGSIDIDSDSWVWLDTIKVFEYSNNSIGDAGLRVRVEDEDGNAYLQLYYGNYGDSEYNDVVSVDIVNDSNKRKIYYIEMKFDEHKNETAILRDGYIWIDEELPVKESWVKVYNMLATNKEPVYLGGCNGSKIYLNVYDGGNNLVHSEYFTDSEGMKSFSVSGLVDSPYSNYRVEIITEQNGEVSQLTGKEYLTTFELLEFKVHEHKTLSAEPFNGQLEFYIDDVLIDSFTQTGSTYQVSYPVSKGKHNFKWVFVENGKGYVWDYAQIDWIELTNWICDEVLVTPYCEKGGGHFCIEALIKCLLGIWKARPKVCRIGKRIWLFT